MASISKGKQATFSEGFLEAPTIPNSKIYFGFTFGISKSEGDDIWRIFWKGGKEKMFINFTQTEYGMFARMPFEFQELFLFFI